MIKVSVDAASALAALAALNGGALRGRLRQAVKNTMSDAHGG